MKTLRNSFAMRTAIPLLAVAGLVLASCSSDDASEDASDTTAQEETTTSESTETTEPMETEEAMELTPTGPACASVPEEGEGSFTGMADDPAATAASNNPALSTLVTAVQEAGLVDTLNSEGPFTIFAPANSAFERIPEDTLSSVLADKEQLTSILTYHVVAGDAMDAEALAEAGTVETVQGGTLNITTTDDGTVMINDAATVVCANIPTANATVHIIDSVLMPAA